MSDENIEKDIEKIKGKIQEISDLDQIENLVMSNIVEFDHKDIKYKVRKPTFREKQEVNQKRIVKYTEFLKDDKLVLEKDLIELYKKRGIDIKEMDDKQDSLNKSRNDLLLKLGKAITEKSPESDLKIYKDEINKIFSEQQELIMRKAVLLDSSIETQVDTFIYTYLGFLLTEKFMNDKWTKAWEKYDDFLNEEEGLVNKVVWNVALISGRGV